MGEVTRCLSKSLFRSAAWCISPKEKTSGQLLHGPDVLRREKSVQTSRIWNDSKLLRLSQRATRWWAPPSSPCLRKEGSLTKTPRSGSPNSVLRLRPPRLARQHLRHKSPVLLFAELNDWSPKKKKKKNKKHKHHKQNKQHKQHKHHKQK